jgi:hypothetical protein
MVMLPDPAGSYSFQSDLEQLSKLLIDVCSCDLQSLGLEMLDGKGCLCFNFWRVYVKLCVPTAHIGICYAKKKMNLLDSFCMLSAKV